MSLELSITTEQSQKLLLSAQMRQSLAVLGMPLQELSAFLTQAASENPMLELLPSEPDDAEEEAFDRENEHVAEDLQEYGEERECYLGCSKQTALEAYGVKRERFTDLLREQLIGITRDEGVLRGCDLLIDCLDQRGYLCSGWNEAAARAGFDKQTVMRAVDLLQSLEPVGVGARNLAECLLLQLAAQTPYDEHAARLVRLGLPLLAKNDYKAIAHLLEIDKKEAQRCAEAVRKLNPIPARGYDSGEPVCYVIPDAVIRQEADGMRILLNRATMPRLTLAENDSLLPDTDANEAARVFISRHTREAKTLIRALEDRNRTVLRVMRCIARRQSAYLQSGGLPAAMTLREIAEETGLHVSTVSRAVKGKYLLCAQGTVAIKSLFSSGMRFGAEAVMTPAMICRQIDALIRSESAENPFSDEDLKRELVSSGFVVSRRTIAKYRTSMGIPASQIRMRA